VLKRLRLQVRRIEQNAMAAVVPDLSVDLAGMKLASPVLTCSGTCGYAGEYTGILDYTGLGAFVTKSITLHERAGNAPYRIVETRAGMLNAIGLANVGLTRFLAEKIPEIRKLPCPVIVNVAGHATGDYVETCAAMNGLPEIAGVELNVSCPNVKDGLTFGTDPVRLRELTREIRRAMPDKPLIVKLSPNVEDIVATARGAIDGGANALSLVNTAMSIDLRTRKPRLANVTGGLSGPAIKPIALHLVSRVYRGVARDAGIPIVGMGGVQHWQDAVEFMLAGATAVAVGTALFSDPSTPNRICEGLREYLGSVGARSLKELVGALELPGDGPRAEVVPPKTVYA